MALTPEQQLQVKNRACSRTFSKWMMPAQVAGALCALAWPLGGMFGGLGIAGMIGMGGMTAIIGLTQANTLSRRIYEGNVSAIDAALTAYDVEEFEAMFSAKKIMGAAPMEPISPHLTSSTINPPVIPPMSSGIAPLPRATAQLDDTAPHLFMVGRTREGKSETLKHLIGGEQRVWYLTSKATDKVPEHWQGYRVGGPDIGRQVEWLLDQWEASFLRHLEGEDNDREWFVIDEAVGIIQSLKTKGFKRIADRLRGFIVECLTAGAAVQAFCGILSQTGNAGPLGVDEDLLKNFSIVGCGKRKKSQMLAAFLKLTDLRVTADQEAEILALDGYWQLWENNGPCLSQVPLSELTTKDVVRCPAPSDDDETESVFVPKVYVEVPTQKQPKNDLRQRILDHLQGHGEARTAREIRNACTRPTDEPRATTEEVKAELEELICDDKICKWMDSTADRYQVTGTV